MGNTLVRPCSAKACGYGAKNRDVACDGGDGSCSSAYFIPAEESDFHPIELKEATARIKEILDPLMAGPDGRALSLLHTPFGTVLAWVKHGQPLATGSVTSANTEDEIAEALGLILEPEQQQAKAY